MNPFSLDHLDPTQFEEFCRDLLEELGFANIDWRKGTGLSTSPSDHGRDITCQREHVDIDGTKFFENWFIECKHFVKGVPPDKLQNILSWAIAERPDKLLIICSNFLSNSAKDYLVNFEKSNRPSFKIKYWERVDLERLTLGMSRLRRKYGIGGDFPHLGILHPAHVLFLRDYVRNSAAYLFEILDGLAAEKRDRILSFTSEMIIQPRYRDSLIGNETEDELRIDDLSYESYKKSFTEKAAVIGEDFLIFSVIAYTLKFMFHLGDLTSADEFIDQKRRFLVHFEEQLKNAETEEDKAALLTLIEMCHRTIDSWPSEVKKNYAEYEYFCENVVQELLLEWLKLDCF